LTFDKVLDVQDKVAEKTKYYAPYNILPLDPDSANQAIMRYPEVVLQFSYFLVSFSTLIMLYHENTHPCSLLP
jgi:hypothetical protein